MAHALRAPRGCGARTATLGVRVLAHHDGKNAAGHPSAYLVFHRKGEDGRAPVDGNLIALDYGALLQVDSLAVVSGEFQEIAHASALRATRRARCDGRAQEVGRARVR